MTTGPNTHTFAALMQNWQNRLVAVERRLARTAAALPGRLQPIGQEVVDWNDAMEAGFYWSGSGALNNPAAALVAGAVYPALDTGFPRTLQVVYRVSNAVANLVYEWRRAFDHSAGTWTPWVAIMSDTGWLTLPVGAGWTSTGSATMQYRVKNGICYLRGEFWGGVDGTVAFDLPPGAEPPARLSVMVTRVATTTNVWGNVVIQTNGQGTFANLGTAGVLSGSPGYSIGNISFPVD